MSGTLFELGALMSAIRACTPQTFAATKFGGVCNQLTLSGSCATPLSATPLDRDVQGRSSLPLEEELAITFEK
jgi:hypothetical protein